MGESQKASLKEMKLDAVGVTSIKESQNEVMRWGLKTTTTNLIPSPLGERARVRGIQKPLTLFLALFKRRGLG